MRFLLIILLLSSCASAQRLTLPARRADALKGSDLFRQIGSMKWDEREPIIEREILSGNIPSFLKKFIAINTSILDSGTGKKINAQFFVSPDYLSVGSDNDWARVPLTPMAAQRIADSLQCFLPTAKMVNDIYRAAEVTLEPVPLYAFRDSALIFWHHHLIIEGQRQGKNGLIAGIKKDVVISGKVSRDARPNRVALYGWHKPDGKPIQPLYTGHVNWYVDYSHGIRLVYRMIRVNDKWMDYKDVLAHPVYKRLLCDEEWCDFVKYPTN